MIGTDWWFVTTALVDNTEVAEATHQFKLEMMDTEDSTRGIVGTLHRWEGTDPTKREVWVIEIEKGTPVVRRAR